MSIQNQGFVPIRREIKQFPLWKHSTHIAMWLWCMVTATHTTYRGLKPGQLYTSKENIAKQTGWSRSTVSSALDALKTQGYIDVFSNRHGTVITINHWNEWMNCDEPMNLVMMKKLGALETHTPTAESDPLCMILADMADEKARTDVQNSEDGYIDSDWYEEYYLNTNNNDNNSPQEENNTHSQKAHQDKLEKDFEDFWQDYPRKIDKAAAHDAYIKLDEPFEKMMAALNNAKASFAWCKDQGRYIPGPAKWLDGQWEKYIADDPRWTPKPKNNSIWETY